MNEEKTGIIKNNKELDTTILTVAGSILAAIVILGLFTLHFLNPENTLLSPEIIMAMLAIPGTLISYAMGKQKGLESMMAYQNSNGRELK